MLTTGELYNDPGADDFDRRIDTNRKIKRLIAQLEGLVPASRSGAQPILDPGANSHQAQHSGEFALPGVSS